MNLLIAFIPAIFWGINPIIVTKTGGSATNQVFGLGLGAVIVAIITTLIVRPTISPLVFIMAFVTGVFWQTGQLGQFVSMKNIGVSKAIPISTGLQLVGNTLIGAFVFQEWQGKSSIIIGLIALVLVVIGSALTSATDRGEEQRVTMKDLLFLVVTTVGYVMYSALPKAPMLAHTSSVAIFLPETLGIFVGIAIFQLVTQGTAPFKQKAQYTNITAGFSWGLGTLTYIIAAQQLGVTTAFIFAQLNVLVATFGGVFVLREKKDTFETWCTLIGLALIIVGAIATTFAKWTNISWIFDIEKGYRKGYHLS